LFAWEGLLGDCCVLLHNIVLHVNEVDKWQWYLELVKGCTVSDVYQLLTNVEPHVASTFSDIIWHKEVPLKVSLFVRRLLSN